MKTKTHIDTLRNSTYLGGWDLLDEHGKTIDTDVTINEIKNEMVFNQRSQSEEPVLTVYFTDCKPIILNATNRKAIKTATGTDFIEEMVGKKITLTTKKVKAFGEVHDAIRILTQPPKVLTPKEIKNAIEKVKAIKTLPELTTLYNSDIKFKTTKEIVDAVRERNLELRTSAK